MFIDYIWISVHRESSSILWVGWMGEECGGWDSDRCDPGGVRESQRHVRNSTCLKKIVECHPELVFNYIH